PRDASTLASPLLHGLGWRRDELDVDALDSGGESIREPAHHAREELPFLALVLRRPDLAGDDAIHVDPIHVARREDVHHALSALLEGKRAQVLRADGFLERAEEQRARTFHDLEANHLSLLWPFGISYPHERHRRY